MNPLLTALLGLSGHKVFVACSGGRDSLALAYACYLLYKQCQLSFLPTILHVHHGMQSANDDWADLVKKWSSHLGFECHVLSVQLDKKTETHARQARYQALASMMNDGDVLLLGHHAQDQAETVLMRLVSGAGVQGLSGMKVWSERKFGNKTIMLHRPWLPFGREQINQFVQTHQLPYVDDPTNDTGDNARSVIRQHILPILSQLNPKAIDNIAKSAKHLAGVTEHIEQTLSDFEDLTIEKQWPFVATLDIQKLCAKPPFWQEQGLRKWLKADDVLPPSEQFLGDVLALIHRQDANHQTTLFWQNQHHAYVICRHKNTLYRYQYELWQWLQTAPSVPKCIDGVWHLGSFGGGVLTYQGGQLAVIDRQSVVTVLVHGVQRHLSGKKLYQTLGIPSWLRHQLWQVSVDGVALALVSVYQAWTLKDCWQGQGVIIAQTHAKIGYNDKNFGKSNHHEYSDITQ